MNILLLGDIMGPSGRKALSEVLPEIIEKRKDKVKFTGKFKGREMQHTQMGRDLLDRVQQDIKAVGKLELSPQFEGRQMIMIIQPL